MCTRMQLAIGMLEAVEHLANLGATLTAAANAVCCGQRDRYTDPFLLAAPSTNGPANPPKSATTRPDKENEQKSQD
eukprot:symbB.v1.2.024166.t1/scaffold2264.1/size174359/21